jgi:molybdopterin converting factor small subunit
MRVQVEFLAILREMTGIKVEWREIAAGTTLEQLWRAYLRDHPCAARVDVVYAVNQKRASADYVLQDGDRVSFLPPLAGGAQRHLLPFQPFARTKRLGWTSA